MREHLQPWYDRWLNEHADTTLRYVSRNGHGDPFLAQVHFIRDSLAGLVWADVPYDKRPRATPREDCVETAFVVGEHMSKSVCLPVFQLERRDLGLAVTLRYNFHDWNVSVSQERSTADLRGFPTGDTRYCFFQGFPAGRRFGTYDANPLRFSMAIVSDHEVYTLLWLLMREHRLAPTAPTTGTGEA